MDIKDLIAGTFEDSWSRLDAALDGLTSKDLAWQPNAACNPISFIVWHMARVEDRWIHFFARGSQDLWGQQGWDTQFGLAASDHGVGFTLEQLAAFPPFPASCWEATSPLYSTRPGHFSRHARPRNWTWCLAESPSLRTFRGVQRRGP